MFHSVEQAISVFSVEQQARATAGVNLGVFVHSQLNNLTSLIQVSKLRVITIANSGIGWPCLSS